jgi:protein-disulfide isomerase
MIIRSPRVIRFVRPAAVALMAIATLGHAAPAPKRPAPTAARDWTQVAVRLPSGDRIGNPDAKVKLVEMLSLTCPHCGVFEAEAVPKLLAKYVRTGRVSYEVRLALRDPIDVAAAVAIRCQGPKRFFELTPALYRSQSEWVTKGYDWLQTNPDLEHVSEAEALKQVLRNSGLDAALARIGMPAPVALKCMDNVAEQRLLADKAKAIWAMPGFNGTPGFLINGKLRTDIHDWAGLDAALAPLAR